MKLRSSLLGGAAAFATLLAPVAVQASSHREAPFISKNPKVDGTDYYAFLSYETGRQGYVTLLANYIPLEDAAGGPNFFTMDPEAIYEVHIDNTGDGVEDLTFQFKFKSTLADAAFPIGPAPGISTKIPFAYAGGGLGLISSNPATGVENVAETYTVDLLTGPRRAPTKTDHIANQAGNTTFAKPVDNIGPNTVGDGSPANYENYAKTFIQQFDLPGCTPTGIGSGTHSRVFVGQRAEGFAVSLGPVFDTVHVSAGPNAIGIPDVIGAQDQGFNDVGNKNVTTIAIEVPASCLANATTKVFGSWTTASVRQARVINPTATFDQPAREGGPFVQISRLGVPLINEVIIGLGDKDRWNSSEPKDDGANWHNYTTNPSLPFILAALFGGAGVTEPQFFPRADLDEAFNLGINLNGINVNQITTTNPTNAEMLRLNTALSAPAAANAQNSQLGALGCFDNPGSGTGTLAKLNPGGHTDCDPNGFPNGRRPGDDVVDIELRAALGALINTTDSPHGGCLHLVGLADGPTAVDTVGPGGCLPVVDGAANNATKFQNVFPYLNSPAGAK